MNESVLNSVSKEEMRKKSSSRCEGGVWKFRHGPSANNKEMTTHEPLGLLSMFSFTKHQKWHEQ